MMKLFLLLLSIFAAQHSFASVLSALEIPGKWEDEHGDSHVLAEWKGKSIVLTMVYANCRKTCPLITSVKLQEIQKLFKEKNLAAQYLLVTMNPEEDTPEVLLHLKQRWHMEQENIHFLRGSEQDTRVFAKAIGIPGYFEMDGHIVHKFRIVYFDALSNSEHSLDYTHRDVSSLMISK